MVEVNAIAEKNLKPMKNEGFSVQYQYAEDKAKLPAVTYYELIDQESFMRMFSHTTAVLPRRNTVRLARCR